MRKQGETKQRDLVAVRMSETKGGQWRDRRDDWDAALDNDSAGCQFSASLGLRRGQKTLVPLVPLDSKLETTLASTSSGEGRTQIYAALPGHQFVVRIRQKLESTADWGATVFFDKGGTPPEDEFDHRRWWGKELKNKELENKELKKKKKEAKVLTIEGMYISPTQSAELTFATAEQPRTQRSSNRGSTSSAPVEASEGEHDDGAGQVRPEQLVGWIIVRYYKVKDWQRASHVQQTAKKPRLLGADAKPALSATPGEVRRDSGAGEYQRSGEYGKEPIFEDEAIFEDRIRYDHFETIKRTVDNLQAEFMRGIPLPVLLESEEAREECRAIMLRSLQNDVRAKAASDLAEAVDEAGLTQEVAERGVDDTLAEPPQPRSAGLGPADTELAADYGALLEAVKVAKDAADAVSFNPAVST